MVYVAIMMTTTTIAAMIRLGAYSPIIICESQRPNLIAVTLITSVGPGPTSSPPQTTMEREDPSHSQAGPQWVKN